MRIGPKNTILPSSLVPKGGVQKAKDQAYKPRRKGPDHNAYLQQRKIDSYRTTENIHSGDAKRGGVTKKVKKALPQSRTLP